MISRREVGLIVAGVGVSSGALSSDIYTTIIIMVATTTILTPIRLKIAYRKKKYNLDLKMANKDSDHSESTTKRKEKKQERLRLNCG